MSGKGVMQQAWTHHSRLDCSAELLRHVIASLIFLASDNLPTGLLSASGLHIFPIPVELPNKNLDLALQLGDKWHKNAGHIILHRDSSKSSLFTQAFWQ